MTSLENTLRILSINSSSLIIPQIKLPVYYPLPLEPIEDIDDFLIRIKEIENQLTHLLYAHLIGPLEAIQIPLDDNGYCIHNEVNHGDCEIKLFRDGTTHGYWLQCRLSDWLAMGAGIYYWQGCFYEELTNAPWERYAIRTQLLPKPSGVLKEEINPYIQAAEL